MKIHILSYPRTQCTYLLNAIVNHYCPEHLNVFEYINEPFNNKPGVDNMLEHFEKSDNIVVKNHVRHFYTYKTGGTERYVPQEKIQQFFDMGWQTYVLARRNLFDQTISYCRARITNEWNNYTNDVISIDTDFFNDTRLALWGSINRLYENTKTLTYTKILYTEDLTGNSILDCEKIVQPNTTMHGPLLANQSPDKKTTIENYNQLQDMFLSLDDFPDIPGVERNGWYIKNIDWSNQ